MSTSTETPAASISPSIDEVLPLDNSCPSSPKIANDHEPTPSSWGQLKAAASFASGIASDMGSDAATSDSGVSRINPSDDKSIADDANAGVEKPEASGGNPDVSCKADIKTEDEGTKINVASDIELDAASAAAAISNEDAASPAKAFFTDEVRAPTLATIHEHGCVQLKFSDYADLFVEATGDDGRAYIFEVQSDILAAASIVFQKMVYDTHKRGTKLEWKDKWVWQLADSAIGLKVLFSILHYKYCAALFTQEPRPKQVYDVLRVFARYGIGDEAFYSCVQSWISGFRKDLKLAYTELSPLECLYAFHKLGDFRSLKFCLRKVAHEVEIGENGTLCLMGKPIQDVVPITDELAANIRAVRSIDLKTLLLPLQKAYDFMMGDSDDGVDYCKSQDGHVECNEKLLGSLLSNLRRQGLRPIPVPAQYTGSVGALAEKVSQLDIRGLWMPNLPPHHQRHGLCRLNQDKLAKELLECKAYLPIYDSLVEEMVLTARRAGTVKQEKQEFEDYKFAFNAAFLKYNEELGQSFWGWDEDAGSTDTELFFHLEDDSNSSIGEFNDSKARKATLEYGTVVV